jgi:ketosteroid isomerase-like protein
VDQQAARGDQPTELELTIANLYQHIDAKRTADVAGLFAIDTVYHRPGYEPITGREALARFYASERVIDDGRHSIDNCIVSGSHVAIEGTFRGVLRDGTNVRFRFAEFFRFEQGLIVERSSYLGEPMGRPV